VCDDKIAELKGDETKDKKSSQWPDGMDAMGAMRTRIFFLWRSERRVSISETLGVRLH
jgi:hypothetical protein